jgi:flagellar hook capping protein FlgD
LGSEGAHGLEVLTGRAVCNLPSQQGEPALVATGGGGAIATWTDGRNGVSSSTDIFALQVLEAGTVDAPAPAPRPISFASPSPNPARESFTLRFALLREARVSLAIYDAAGRRVRELASGLRPEGEQSITWDRRDGAGHTVHAGLYFARLEADGSALTQKLVTLE